MAFRNKKASKTYRPEGEIRRSQLLMGYGPGAMIDLLDDAVLIGGLDYWRYQDTKNQAEVIEEPRLTQKLVETMRLLGQNPSTGLWLQAPPECNYDEAHPRQGIQALEFPRFFKCQRCNVVAHATEFEEAKRGRVHHCGPGYGKKPAPAVPVRFVAVCEHGHIDDWPWEWWTHFGKPMCDAPDIRLREGASGDISEIEVTCANCNASMKLASAMVPELRPNCSGARPWLGDRDIAAEKQCDQKARLLVRTATNGYLAQSMSALSLPSEDSGLAEAVNGLWATLGEVADLQELQTLRKLVPQVKQSLPSTWGDAAVLRAIERRRAGQSTLPPLDIAEYEAFDSAPIERDGEQPKRNDIFFAREMRIIPTLLPTGIEKVVLAPKLREVRAQFGFSRLEAAIPGPDGSYPADAKIAPLTLDPKWLPAIEINGEGLFIRFDELELAAWEQRKSVGKRHDQLLAGFNRWAANRSSSVVFRGVRYYMLHTLAHLLMTAIALECGYAASSIRERIYCREPDTRRGEEGMAGILLSTGTPGSEGTLGGLVEQGRHLRYHLRRAYELGTLCSGDPVCALHQPELIHDERSTEGAACHSCVYVPETSCESFNRFLDRALVFPTIGHPDDLAFFTARP